MFLSGCERSINGSVYDRQIAETIAGPCKKKIKKAGNKPVRRHIPKRDRQRRTNEDFSHENATLAPA